MPPAGFGPTTTASWRPQTHALDRAATGTGSLFTSAALNTENKLPDLNFSKMLRVIGWCVSDVSGECIRRILQFQDVVLDSLTLEGGIDTVYQNVGNKPSNAANSLEERMSQRHREESLRSRSLRMLQLYKVINIKSAMRSQPHAWNFNFLGVHWAETWSSNEFLFCMLLRPTKVTDRKPNATNQNFSVLGEH